MTYLFLILLSLNVLASDAEEVDYIREMDDEAYLENNPRIYRAEGEHQCQSSESIGHTCKNLGVNFSDCNAAFYTLKRDDCCTGSKYGGVSIGFKVTKCTNLF
jgi:hypothetical protein